MLETILPEEMKALEADFIRDQAVPSILLMERAASAVTDAVARHVQPGARVLFLCGPGNNGGDGYAAARLWAAQGGRATVWELTGQVQGDAEINRRLLIMSGISPLTLEGVLPAVPDDASAVVDALFGTGLTRPLQGIARLLAQAMNAARLPVIAVDLPSGLHGGTGENLGDAIAATETVTFHRIKQGLVLRDGTDVCGHITCVPILMPVTGGHWSGLSILTAEDAARMRPPRPASAHKGSFGRVLILAGSEGMMGAAALCANACMRAGAGLTTVACRASLVPLAQALAPCATCLPLAEQNGRLTGEAVRAFTLAASHADAIACGCGLGVSTDLIPLLDAAQNARCPVVWDADALNLRATYPELFAPVKSADLLTPHPGEAARLLHRTVAEITADPLDALDALRDACGGTVLLKGARTLMGDSFRRAVNLTGTPAMAKGGSGDVLTGILAALLAQKRQLHLTTLEVAQLGAFLHGKAGEAACILRGENAVMACDLVDQLS